MFHLNYSLLDVWNHEALKIFRGGTKLVFKGISSAIEKEKIKASETPELVGLFELAESGNSYAQCDLGLYYIEKKDYKTALYWFEQSAEQGNEKAIEIMNLFDGE